MKKNEKGKQSLTPTETIGLIKYLGYPPSLYQSLKNSLGREPNLEELSDALLKIREKKSLKIKIKKIKKWKEIRGKKN